MINFRKIRALRRSSFIGKLLRLPFKLIPANAVLPILRGAMCGKHWIKGSHNVSVLFGIYEQFQSRAFYSYAKTAKVFWDLGAHVGYYSLLYKCANPLGKIYAFEPVVENSTMFNKHMALNKIYDVHLLNVAVSNFEGELLFNRTKTSVSGRLSNDGDYKVSVVKLSELLARGIIEAPELIKIDIEGEENKVLQEMQVFLTKHKPIIFLSTHGINVHHKCISKLLEIGYSLKPLDSEQLETCQELLVY